MRIGNGRKQICLFETDYTSENVPLRGVALSFVGQAVQSWIANEMPGLMFEGRTSTPLGLLHRPLGHIIRPAPIKNGRNFRESRPGESHPEALAEPYVTLSRHTAPIKEPPRIVAQGANRCGERREAAATHRRARRT